MTIWVQVLDGDKMERIYGDMVMVEMFSRISFDDE
jgi:hypothetical protein